MIKRKINAFTLAETLITLMVIGVVAALTIPSLMNSWKDKQYDTARKKAMTTVANGYKLMVADNDGNTSGLPLFECGDDFACLSGIHKKFFSIAMDKSKTHDGLAEKYIKNGDSTEEAGFKWDDVPYIFTTSDGMTYGYLANGFDVVVDVNGEKAPNKICKDVFKLRFTGNTVNNTRLKDGNEVALCEDLDNGIETASSGNSWENWLKTPCTEEQISRREQKSCFEHTEYAIDVYNDQGIAAVAIYDPHCFINVPTDDAHYSDYISTCAALGYTKQRGYCSISPADGKEHCTCTK